MERRLLEGKETIIPNLGDILIDGGFVEPKWYTGGGKGVVIHVDLLNKTAIVIGRRISTAAWGTNIKIDGIPMTTEKDQALSSFTGFEDTHVLKSHYGEVGEYAFQKCLAVPNVAGFNQSGWYLPSVGEISYIANSFSVITSSMIKISGLFNSNNWGNHCLLTTQYNSAVYWCWDIDQMEDGIPNGLASNLKSSNYTAPVYPMNKIFFN